MRQRGYHLLRQFDVAPSEEELAYLDRAIVSPLPDAEGHPLPVPASWEPFPSVGEERLYVSPSRDEGALPTRFIQPLISRRRGQPTPGVGYIGVDSRVWMNERPGALPDAAPLALLALPEEPEFGPPRRRCSLEELLRGLGLGAPVLPATRWDGQPGEPVRVAVIDTDCGGWGALRGVDPDTLRPEPGGGRPFPRGQEAPERAQPIAGHGVVMAAAVETLAPGVRLGLFEIPFAHQPYLHATDLAAALARAVEGWGADVVLVAMAHAVWGTPAHLRAILRGCARSGRGGRGAILVCCTGRIDQNRDVRGDSTVLAADDFNAQPWVLPVGACGLEGSWYRIHGRPLGRRGPSVELCAPGELVTFPPAGAADDSSLAAALVAGTAARLVAIHPGLSLAEVRQVLRETALKQSVEEAPETSVSRARGFQGWDGAGHHLELGYGRLDTLGACLSAADPLCLALMTTRRPGTGPQQSLVEARELEEARRWESLVRRLEPHHALAREYVSLRGHLVPLVLHDPELRDALFWLVRHLRAHRWQGPGTWPDAELDQGALTDRCLHVCEVLRGRIDQTPRRGPSRDVSPWLARLTGWLESTPAQHLAHALAEVLTRPTGLSG